MRLFSFFQSKFVELFESHIETESPYLMDDGLSMGLELSASGLDLIDDSMHQDAMQFDSGDLGGCDFGDTDFGCSDFGGCDFGSGF